MPRLRHDTTYKAVEIRGGQKYNGFVSHDGTGFNFYSLPDGSKAFGPYKSVNDMRRANHEVKTFGKYEPNYPNVSPQDQSVPA